MELAKMLPAGNRTNGEASEEEENCMYSAEWRFMTILAYSVLLSITAAYHQHARHENL